MKIQCSNCGADVEFSKSQLGKIVKCSKCGEKIKIHDENNNFKKTLKEIKKIDNKLAKNLEKNLKFKS